LIGQNFKPIADGAAMIRLTRCFPKRQSYWQSILPVKKCTDNRMQSAQNDNERAAGFFSFFFK